MISIVKCLFEWKIGDADTYKPEQQGPITGTVKYWTPIRSDKDVIEAKKEIASEWSERLAKQRAEHAEALKKAATKAADATSGTEAAGIALSKGAKSAGEAVGGFGKKAMEFAGEHPAAAMGVAGAGLAAALMARRKKNQTQQ